MAHELSIRANGFVEHAYTGQVGWHRKGNPLPADASIEEWIKAAGMDWHINRSPVMYQDHAGNMVPMPGKEVLSRSDTGFGLAVVSDNYKEVNPPAIVEFFRDLASDNGFTLDTAGVLFGGRRFWAFAKIGALSYVRDPADTVKGNLLLSTSCDGTMATDGRFVAERVVCNNTLQMALGESGGTRVKVSHRSVFNESALKRKLGVQAESAFESTMDELRKLAHSPMARQDVARNTVNLLHPDTFDAAGNCTISAKELDKLTRSAPISRIAELALDGRGLIGAKMAGMEGTGYGWLNAVTQYVDHEARSQNDENRLNSALFGKGSELKTRAFEMALANADGTVTVYADTPAEAPQADSDFASLMSRPLTLA